MAAGQGKTAIQARRIPEEHQESDLGQTVDGIISMFPSASSYQHVFVEKGRSAITHCSAQGSTPTPSDSLNINPLVSDIDPPIYCSSPELRIH
jgi:hypothetical protein